MTDTKRPTKTTARKLAGSHVTFNFRRQVLPLLAGLAVFVAVFGFFNAELISGQIAYFIYERQAHVAQLDSETAYYPVNKNAPPQIIINKINVTAPVNFSETEVNEWAFLQDLQHAVVHYPGTALPGQVGNVVVFGHSSGAWWTPGDYKFVFTLLDKLTYGDKIFIDYQGVRYIYSVYNTKVIPPTDMSILNQSGTHMLTLLTCTPVGTSTNRLAVQALQISPSVSNGSSFTQPAALPASAQNASALPDSFSFWQDVQEFVTHIFRH